MGIRTLLAAMTLIVLAATAAAEDPDARIAKLAWLGGCWESESAEPGSGEHWMPPAGGTLLGVGRTVKDGRTVAFEFMQIRTIEDGRLAFIAMPSAQRTVTFPALEVTDTHAVFENPDHDFPQRVIYELADEDQLRARIEGDRDGELRVVEFPMRRVGCEVHAADPKP